MSEYLTNAYFNGRQLRLCLGGADHLVLLNELGDCDRSQVQMPRGQCHTHISTMTIKGLS